jgi:hypothetical protein
MTSIRLRKDQRDVLSQAITGRYLTPASATEMLLRLDRNFEQLSVTGSTFGQNLLAVVRTAESEGWVLGLVREVRRDVPGDQALEQLEGELAPLAPPPHVDLFDVCRLGGRVMVDRSLLRASLRLLSTPLGKRIMIVTGAECSGKSHSFELISYLREIRGGFSPALIDLEAYQRALGPGTEITPDHIVRTLIKLLRYPIPPPEPPQDKQWARWVIDFCDDLVAYGRDEETDRWLVVDGFGKVQLAQASTDLVNELAIRVRRDLPRFRLILLGYDDPSWPRSVRSQVEREHIEPIWIPELLDFFNRAYQQLRVPFGEADLVATVSRVLAGLDQEDRDFLYDLEERVNDELVNAQSGGGGP